MAKLSERTEFPYILFPSLINFYSQASSYLLSEQIDPVAVWVSPLPGWPSPEKHKKGFFLANLACSSCEAIKMSRQKQSLGEIAHLLAVGFRK